MIFKKKKVIPIETQPHNYDDDPFAKYDLPIEKVDNNIHYTYDSSTNTLYMEMGNKMPTEKQVAEYIES